MEPLSINVIANFFDEIEEKWLEPFDWCPNEQLPHAQRKTYRIKDLFKIRYRNKICRYKESEVDLCRIEFHYIFRYNILHAIQSADEISKLKMMADHDHYDSVTSSDRTVNSNTTTNDTSNNRTTNKTTGLNKRGNLTGSVDAIQLGSVLQDSLLDIDTEKLPNKVDRNIRQYTQGVDVVNDLTDVTIEDIGGGNSNVTSNGTQNTKARQGIEALNQYRAHSLQVRRLHEEFVQCFNVLFW